MSIKNKALGLLCGLVIAGGTAGPAHAMYNATRVTESDSFGASVVRVSTNCTGTAIAAHWVLTARHCEHTAQDMGLRQYAEMEFTTPELGTAATVYGWGRGSGNYLRRGAVEVLERTREYGDAKHTDGSNTSRGDSGGAMVGRLMRSRLSVCGTTASGGAWVSPILTTR